MAICHPSHHTDYHRSMTASTIRQRIHRRKENLRHGLFTRLFNTLHRFRITSARPGIDYVLNELTLPFPSLPSGLVGMKITQLSDLHVGKIFTPDLLPAVIDAANGLDGDLIVVTGDLIDHDNRYLDAVIEACTQLSAPLGVYYVLGNHDVRDDPVLLKQRFREAGLRILDNAQVPLNYHGTTLSLAGIDWSGKAPEIARFVNLACRSPLPADFRILLTHHPHAFDPAIRHGINLVLAGHTHGGQFILKKTAGNRGMISPVAATCRYPGGLYAERHGKHQLYVSAGLGGSFPLRIGCPAEITSISLEQAD